MNQMPSAEFRKQYAKLTEPTVVTVNGHPIGEWLPARTGTLEGLGTRIVGRAEVERAIERAKLPGGGVQARAQSQRDDLLRRINRG